MAREEKRADSGDLLREVFSQDWWHVEQRIDCRDKVLQGYLYLVHSEWPADVRWSTEKFDAMSMYHAVWRFNAMCLLAL